MSVVTRSVNGAPSRTAQTPFGDRQLDVEAMREIAEHRCRRQPLDDHADLRSGLLGPRAARDELPRPPIPAGRRPARDDQVSHSGQSGERVRPRARRLGEPPHLCQAARDERRLGVVAEREAVRPTCGERDDVLRRRAELDADDVVAHVDAEEDRVHRDLDAHGELEVVARDDGCRRKPAHDLVGDVRAREDGDGAVPNQGRESRAGCGVEPLREADDGRIARKRRHDLGEHATRNGDEDELGVGDRRCRRSSPPRSRRGGPPSRSAGSGPSG